jgi:hypothetical protein
MDQPLAGDVLGSVTVEPVLSGLKGSRSSIGLRRT